MLNFTGWTLDSFHQNDLPKKKEKKKADFDFSLLQSRCAVTIRAEFNFQTADTGKTK